MDAVISVMAMAVSLAVAPHAQHNDTVTRHERQTIAATRAMGVALERIAPQAATRPLGERKRRRGMIAYIEDATVTSQVRVRFDVGFGIDAPDRAEFFYAKCGCYKLDDPPFFDPDAPGPGPGVPTELNFQQLYVQGEHAMRPGLSLFAELPVRAIQPQGFEDFGPRYAPFPDQSGIADIRFGAKVSLRADENRDLTLQVRASTPTGNASKGLSIDHWSIEPVLLYQQTIGERAGIEAQFGTFHPFGGSVGAPTSGSDKFSGDVLFYGIGPSFDLVANDRFRFSPVLELVGWHVMGGSQTLCPGAQCTYAVDDHDNIVNLKLGARVTAANRNSFYAGYGWALTDAVWYERVFRLEYRYEF
jgi:hypothetical protein